MNFDWPQFYTPIDTAKEVLKYVPESFMPEYALDICVGSGNFLHAANEKWSNVKLIGVDKNEPNLCSDLKKKMMLIQMDAFNLIDSPELLHFNKSKAKIILANPPFGKLKEAKLAKNSTYDPLLELAVKTKRQEALMLVSNLTLMNIGDFFGAILPENFFTSTSMCKFKNLYLNYFDIKYISKTNYFFSKSEVKCRILVGQFRGTEGLHKKHKDYKYKMKYEILRGVDNSKLLPENSICSKKKYDEVIHFSNSLKKIISQRFIELKPSNDKKRVHIGDLIIGRVGRCAGLVTICDSTLEGKVISDYFFLIKSLRLGKSKALTIERELLAKKRGLTTSYLTKGDISEAIENSGQF